jgi:hypothetical protein
MNNVNALKNEGAKTTKRDSMFSNALKLGKIALGSLSSIETDACDKLRECGGFRDAKLIQENEDKELFQVFIYAPTGIIVETVRPTTFIHQIYDAVRAKLNKNKTNTFIGINEFLLTHNGKILMGGLDNVYDYNIRPNANINVLMRMRGGNSSGKHGLQVFLRLPDRIERIFILKESQIQEIRHTIVFDLNFFWQGFYLLHNGRRLKPLDNIDDYNICDGDTIHVIPNLNGGSESYEITEKQDRRQQYKSKKYLKDKYRNKIESAKIQASEEFDFSFLSAFFNKMSSQDTDFYVKLVEDVALSAILMKRAKNKTDFTLSIMTFLKLRLGDKSLFSSIKSYVKKLIEDLFVGYIQSDDEEDIFSIIKNIVNGFEKIQETNTYKKLFKLFTYILSVCVFQKLGIQVNIPMFGAINKDLILKCLHKGNDFIVVILQALIYIVERIYVCVKTKSFTPLFTKPDALGEWCNGVYLLRTQANFLGNPEPHGFNKFDFIDRLNKHIEQGDAFLKHSNDLGSYSKSLISSLLNDLKMIKATELTKSAAGKERKAPFATLVYGKSSIAKSVFVDVMFAHYAKVHKLPDGPEYIYTRNPADDYWSGFDSSKWGLKMDDVAFMHPNKGSDIDPTLKEIIQVVNNVPYLPAQADLADKGKTPLQCELVTATTNTAHLNAQFYFSCPLAVRRRLPYVIELTVKEQYKREGGNHMIDPVKLPEVLEGYPDYWNITVSKVEPGCNDGEAVLTAHSSYSDINEFLAWFSRETIKFKKQQDNVMNINKFMRELEICNTCYKDLQNCECVIGDVQSRVEPDPVNLFSWEKDEAPQGFLAVICVMMELYLCIVPHYVITTCVYLAEHLVCYILDKVFNSMYNALKQRIAIWYLTKVSNQIFNKHNYKVLSRTIQGLTCLLAAYKFYRMCRTTAVNLEPQSTETETATKGTTPKKDKKQRPDVWYNDSYQTTPFDVMPQAESYSSMNREQLKRTLQYNLIHINSTCPSKPGVNKPTKAICLVGHYWMANNHGIPEDEVFTISIIQDVNAGVNANISFSVTQNMVKRFPEDDVCIIYIRQIPPRKDIRQLFCKQSLKGNYNGFYLRKNRVGELDLLDVKNINHSVNKIAELDIVTEVWRGNVETPTQNGDCGSLLIADSPRFCILGMHVFGEANMVGSLKISYEKVNYYIKDFYSDVPIIQSDVAKRQIQAVPMLSCEDRERQLVQLHYKSPFRYVEEGVAEIKGSFNDFRPSPTSRVNKTFICDRICEEPGYSILHTRPPMKGWEVKRTNILGMVNPVTEMRADILEMCAKSYYQDIKEGLPQGQLEMLEIYNDDVTLNGCDGVAYVNKMNRNTSMGAPWKRSKKFYLEPIGDSDKVKLTDDVMKRINQNLQTYKKGERCHAVFSMTLKDEPITHKKASIHKVRGFQNAPIDLNFLDRKYNLSFIRLVQNNQLLFECACGIVAQSTEWNDLYEYLDKYKNVVAGDYKEFDKRMPSVAIFYAYMVKTWLQRDAGYSEEDLRVVHGIDTDKNYPLVDVFGDLVQFMNGNPSGQTLTVTINSIVNSLYIRYAYYMLNPNKEVRSFKKNVRLMTYGDDNIMTVSDDCPWFNHTTIAECLGNVGITYTMADKEAESVPYITLEEASFLKRIWRYDEDIGTRVAPLDHDSINKSLTMCVVSKTITPEAQAIASISNACREYFWYGKEIFEEKRRMLQQVIFDCKLELYQQESTLPTWQQLYEDFWQVSGIVKLE